MKNNIHRLTEDWRMYFCGSFIFATVDGEDRAMYVEDVVRTGDDTDTEGMEFLGIITRPNGDQDHGRWPANWREEFRPISGYYRLGNNQHKTWVTFNVPNRTQRKGVDNRNVLLNGTPGCSHLQMLKIFEQSQEYVSKPGTRDFYIKTNGEVHWKGFEVGRMTDGNFVANDHHKNKEALLWRLLQSI